MPVRYVRVKGRSGQEWDEPEGSPLIASGAVQVVKAKRYPPSTVIRPTKRHVTTARSRRVTEPEPAGEGTTTEKE